MNENDTIQTMRRKVQELEDKFVALAASATPAGAAKALDLVALELHDVDRALYEAVFLRNDSTIKRLIDEIESATQGGKAVLNQLEELRGAVDKARAAVQAAAPNLNNAKALLDEVQGVIDSAKGQAGA